MTTYLKITINGNTISDIIKADVSSSIGDNNSCSSFRVTIDNSNGEYSDTYSIGNEIVIYIEKTTNPPTTKILTGLIEDINFSGKPQTEIIELIGRDYTARLMDVTVEPEVYNDGEVSTIVTDIIGKYVDDITTTNVETTSTTIPHITFNQVPVFDALKQLADLSGFTFWVDNDKDLNFKVKGGTSSGETLNNTNILDAKFRKSDKELYNKIWVYGDKTFTKYKNEFVGDGVGSEFTLDFRPHNTDVVGGGSYTYKGGVFELLVGAPLSGTEYLVNYDQKKLIFVSGTFAGDNIPPGSIVVNYDRSTPIIKYGEDKDSISNYGPRTKVIVDKSIVDPQQAKDLVNNYLEDFTAPAIQGTIKIEGIINLTAGNTIVVDVPNHNINEETFDILEVRYDLSVNNLFSDSVTTIRVNRRIKDISDTIKQMALDIKKLQATDYDIDDVFTRLEYFTGSFGMQVAEWNVKTKTLGSSFILGKGYHDVTGDTFGGIVGSVVASGINFLGDSRTGFTTQQSGGTWT